MSGNREVINADFGWSDLGTWGSLYGHIPQDESNNALIGKKVLTLLLLSSRLMNQRRHVIELKGVRK